MRPQNSKSVKPKKKTQIVFTSMTRAKTANLLKAKNSSHQIILPTLKAAPKLSAATWGKTPPKAKTPIIPIPKTPRKNTTSNKILTKDPEFQYINKPSTKILTKMPHQTELIDIGNKDPSDLVIPLSTSLDHSINENILVTSEIEKVSTKNQIQDFRSYSGPCAMTVTRTLKKKSYTKNSSETNENEERYFRHLEGNILFTFPGSFIINKILLIIKNGFLPKFGLLPKFFDFQQNFVFYKKKF
jgi:hypothetical protein